MEIYTIYRRKDSPKVTMDGPENKGLKDGLEFDNVRLAAEHARECGRNSGSSVVRVMTHDNYLEEERPIPQDTPQILNPGRKPSTYF
jgi:hypothetical protein